LSDTKPIKKIGEALIDVVDVERCNFHASAGISFAEAIRARYSITEREAVFSDASRRGGYLRLILLSVLILGGSWIIWWATGAGVGQILVNWFWWSS
jgi:hypothetical protein